MAPTLGLALFALLTLLTIEVTYGSETGVSMDEFLTIKNLVTQQNDVLQRYKELAHQRKLIEKLLKVHLNEKRSVSTETVAFHACFDHDVEHLGNSHELAFNIVVTDTHSAYEKYSGTYIVPIPGIYVFSWVTPIYNGDIPFQQIVNGAVKGKTDPSNNAHISSTGVAVLSLNEHDAVMIRTHPNFTPRGKIEGNTWMNACFSGWKL